MAIEKEYTVSREANLMEPLPAKTVEFMNERQNYFPVWVRAPISGTEFYSGFSRAKLYELASQRKIRSVSIRESGQVKGTRLFNLQSIFEFIESYELTDEASVGSVNAPAR